jgi:hypothetical protein
MSYGCDTQKAGALARLYSSVADVDLYVGGISENPTRDSLFGPTFACIIGDQLQRLRVGDRFFYDGGSAQNCPSSSTTSNAGSNPYPFTQAQVRTV